VAGWILAIDFGTTSTAAAVQADGTVSRVEVDGSPRMPSLVFWREGTGSTRSGRLVLGEEADELSSLAPWCLERTPKRRIGDEFMRLGEKELRVTDVIGAILRKVADEALRTRGGEPPSEVRLTYPARWSRPRLDKLREAARIAGFDAPVFIPEPVAAAMHFARERLTPGQYVAVYDLGGGTFDTAVLKRTEDAFEVVGRPGGDEELGGEDFDDRMYRYLGRQLPEDRWQSLRTSKERAWTQANRDFLRQARRTKEYLSRSPHSEFYAAPPIDQELHASAETFRELIVSDLEATVVELERTIQSAGLEPSDLAAIYLAGGSSRIPLIARLIQRRLGQLPEYLDDPKSVVALGAASAPLTASAGSAPAPAAATGTVTAPPSDAARDDRTVTRPVPTGAAPPPPPATPPPPPEPTAAPADPSPRPGSDGLEAVAVAKAGPGGVPGRRRLLAAALVAALVVVAAIVALTSGGGGSGGPKGEPAVAALAAVPTNHVTGNGSAKVELKGNVVTVTLDTNGLLNGAPHALHIHAGGQGACPPASAARLHNTHLAISTTDGIRFYGPPVTALTVTGDTTPASILAFGRFPSVGNIRYVRTFTVPAPVAAYIRQNNAVIVAHGIDYDGTGIYSGVLDRSDLDKSLPGTATAPALCGPLHATQAVAGGARAYTASLSLLGGAPAAPARAASLPAAAYSWLCHLAGLPPGRAA
jgi:actin-like ATPase involved in cell morphogenesis